MPDRGPRAGLLPAAFLILCASAAEAVETVAYGYDSLGRLVRVERSGTVNDGVKAAYAYDPADNRTNVTVSAPTVKGGSFELPEIGAGYAYGPGGSPALFGGRSGIAGNGSVWGFAAAPDGDQAAFVQSYGTASTVKLPVAGLSAGTRYAFRFRIAARPGYSPNPVTVTYEGVGLGTFQPASHAFVAVTTAAFTAAAAGGTLVFTGSGSSADLGTGLDFVTVAAEGTP